MAIDPSQLTVLCSSCNERFPLVEMPRIERGRECLCEDCLDEDDTSAWIFLIIASVGVATLAITGGSGNLWQVVLLAAIWSQLTVLPHELGHLLAARIVGWRALGADLGSGPVRFRWRMFGVPWRFRSLSPSGSCETAPRSPKSYGLKNWLVSAAGPSTHAIMLTPLLFESVRADLWEWNLAGFMWAGFFAGNVFDLVWNLRTESGLDGETVWSRPRQTEEENLDDFIAHVQAYSFGYTDEGDCERARELVKDLLATDGLPDAVCASAHAQLVWCELMAAEPGYLDRAHAHLVDAAEVLPHHPRVQALVGCFEIERGKFASGKNLLDEVIDEEDDRRDRARYLMYRAWAEHGLEDVDAASKNLSEAISIDPNSPIRDRIEPVLLARAS